MAADTSLSQPALTHILQSNIDDLRNLVSCRICVRPMYEPYTTQCGHTFCYSCLRQWFDRDHSKKTCPDCRAHVVNQPAPAYLVREITQTFINTAALLPPGENTEDHRQFQREEAEIVDKDRSNHNPDGGLFNGRFKPHLRRRSPIRDAADGVIRCPTCAWELDDGMCNSCGYILGLDAYSHYDDDEDFISDAQSFSSNELEEILADHPDYLDYDSTGSGNYRSHRRHMDHSRRRAGLPTPRPTMRRNRHRPVSPMSSSSESDFLSDDSGSPTSSLRNFMVEDMAVDGDAGSHSDDSSDSSEHGPRSSPSDSERSHADEEPSDLHSDTGSDTTLVTTARQRSRRPRIATSSPEASDSDASHFTRSSRLSSYDDVQNQDSGGFSPLQPNLDDHNSQDIPIQIDSDSDAPPIRRVRKRPTAVLVSSDEEDNDTRGVAIQSLPSDTASNRASVDSGGQSPSLGSPDRSREETSPTLDNAPSPIMIASSPVRPGSSRRDRSSNMLSPSSAPYPQRSPSGVPSGRSSTREHIRRRRSRSLTGQSSPSPHHRFEQRREDRKRAKRQIRQRRLHEQQSRGRADPLGQPQQLAYIGV